MRKKQGFGQVIALLSLSAALIGTMCSCAATPAPATGLTAITNVRIFDGEKLLDDRLVVLNGSEIQAVGGEIPAGATVIDGQGGTLLPGLIDSHVHTDLDGLRDALKFGVTTELEMNGHWSASQRQKISLTSDIADLLSPENCLTAPGGHPTQYIATSSNLLLRYFYKYPTVSTPEAAVKFVDKQVAAGADYLKIIIEEGTVVGTGTLPTVSDEVIFATVTEAHNLGKMAIAHVTTVAGTLRATANGVDGLAHLFFDRPLTPEEFAVVKDSGVFIVPTLVTISSALGHDAADLAADERVSSRLEQKWLDSLAESMNTYPAGDFADSLAAVKALYDAGVDILAGSDVSEPIPGLGGLAHGASLHHELKLLVAAGLEPIEALRAATSVPARRFGLAGRGVIAPGAYADLLLVEGDPLTDIDDTLNIRAVWHRGVRLAFNLDFATFSTAISQHPS
jgi:imidazolonepropionase-like amidohydrolase